MSPWRCRHIPSGSGKTGDRWSVTTRHCSSRREATPRHRHTRAGKAHEPTPSQPNALVVTRSRAKASRQAEAEARDKQEGAVPSPVEETNPFSALDADLFQDVAVRQPLTR